jgi:hypothetical protein
VFYTKAAFYIYLKLGLIICLKEVKEIEAQENMNKTTASRNPLEKNYIMQAHYLFIYLFIHLFT